MSEIRTANGGKNISTKFKNWHFEPGGHKHFHEEMDKRKREEERIKIEQERIRREKERTERARRDKFDHIYVNSSAKSLFQTWIRARKVLENCSVEVFDSSVVVLYNVSLNGSFASARAKGGEKIEDVMNRKDEDEMYSIRPGYFAVPYRNKDSKCKLGNIGNAQHLKSWSTAVKPYREKSEILQTAYNSNFTICITRYEYANVFWTIMDLYDTYLTVAFLNQTMNNTQLLIVDAHPDTPLDGLWYGTFKKVVRPHQLNPVSVHKTLAWTFGREMSPMLSKTANLALINEFRKTVLQSFNVSINHKPDCQRLRVTFVWRRDYVAHPRNPKGIIQRKISNEQELVSAVRRKFPVYNVTGIQLDTLPMVQQLQLLAHTDVFVGMHGAAFGFCVLLTPGSSVVELFPLNFSSNWHMEYLAKRAGHHYFTWKNKDETLEDKVNFYTKVPPSTIIDLIDKTSRHMCGSSSKPMNKEPVPAVPLKTPKPAEA